MHIKRLVMTIIGALSLLGALGAGIALAAPANAPSAQTTDLICEANSAGINTITIVALDNNGQWTPGHIVSVNGESANLTAIPLEFQFTVTDSEGNVYSDTEVKPGNRIGVTNTVTCSGSLGEVTDETGTYTVDVTVTAFIASKN